MRARLFLCVCMFLCPFVLVRVVSHTRARVWAAILAVDVLADSSEALPEKVALRVTPIDIVVLDPADHDQAHTCWSYKCARARGRGARGALLDRRRWRRRAQGRGVMELPSR